MSSGCPRCGKSLEAAQVNEISVRLCGACKGLLIAHPALTKVADQSWRAVPEKVAEETAFRRSAGIEREPIYACPDCHRPMEKYGYMGLAAITIDRCETCALVWLDADELQNLVLALAKSNYRSARALRAELDQPDIVGVGMAGAGAMAGRLPGAWLFGDASGTTGQVVAVAQVLLNLLLR